MAGLRTEYPFELPKGWIDSDGKLHRKGRMRLATARDELEPLSDPGVEDADDPRLAVIVLSRVIVQLGDRDRLTPRDVEGFFAADVAYLQDVYSAINYGTDEDIKRVSGGKGNTAPLPAELIPASDVDEDDDDAPAKAKKATAAKAAPKGRRARIEEVGKTSRPRTGGR